MTARSLDAERWLYTGLVASTTSVAAARLWSILRVDGFTPLKFTLLVLFACLFAWIAASFWMAVLGACLRWMRVSARGGFSTQRGACERFRCNQRAAIVVPVYNENAVEVFARIEAMHESLGRDGANFDFFVLSDSTDAEAWIAEELEWDRLRRARTAGARIFYRHRRKNEGRKSGNIRDFCENWGAQYEYMAVLDADSLMTGATLVELVRRMNANPGVALIQVPPALVGRQALFARIQQFASSVYGPLYFEGLARLQGPDGNYWGHNAIIRTRAFAQTCGLPNLPGKPPLGGEILSHDFVEAALLRRAGWQTLMAPDLSGSYEEPPPSLLHHVARDRRWCEGNLQHIPLIFGRGFRLPSRMHLAVGVMSYVSAPLWLFMMIAAVVEMYRDGDFTPVRFEGRFPVLGASHAHTLEFALLAMVAALLLFAPKWLGLFVLARDRDALAAHGGFGKAAQSVFLESLLSTLIAPVVMLSHAFYVMDILAGRSASWSAQQREDCDLALPAAARWFGAHTLVGLGATALAAVFIPDGLPWLSPLLLGLVLAIPLVKLTASPAAGRLAARLRLFLVPSETVGVPIVERARTLAKERLEKRFYARPDLTRLVIEDPFVNALHRLLLGDLRGADEEGADVGCGVPDTPATGPPRQPEQWRMARPPSV